MSYELVKDYLTARGYGDRAQEFAVSSATVELAAAALGVFLQVLVTENSRLVALFQTAALSGAEWRELLFLAAAPMAAHELLAGLSRISGARGTAEKERSGS